MQLAKPDQGDVGASLAQKRSKGWLSTAGLLLLSTLAWAWGTHEFHNCLEAHPDWSSTKPTLRLGVNGAVTFMRTPAALEGDRLNLGSFWGYQEILFSPPGPLQELSWAAEVPVGSLLVVVYERTDAGFSGVRLSRNPHYPSMVFNASGEGEV